MGKKIVVLIIGMLSLFLFKVTDSYSQSQVVPCQLTNADQDLLRLFPERTNYRAEFIRTDEVGDKRGVGGEALYRELEKRLGDKWDPIWETKDIPYVFYEVLKGPDKIGWSFGANQGWPGSDNSQLMFAFDLDERIREFYYQKLPSPEKSKLQFPQFYSQFVGLTLEHFYVNEQLKNLAVKDNDILALDMVGRIKDPTQKEHEGFLKTLRGIKKVLIYLDDFKLNNKIKKDEVFANVKYVVTNKSKIPLIEGDVLSQIKKSFPDASTYVVDFISLKSNSSAIERRLGDKLDSKTEPADLVYPVYVVYKTNTYKPPFTRGIILGYVLPLAIDTAQGRFVANIAIGAQDKEKGKIVSAEINKIAFNQFKGLSLVHFYTKDVLTKNKIVNEKIDKIAPITNINVDGKDITPVARRTVKKALVIVDEYYFHNFFNKEEITKKMEDYLKSPKK
ncbi:MAG: hypothetical protein QG641_1582 [Candidatus Poribacteria bacterium]|nr:hypothetical protein [Candidatus Poribacteria bacterium]